MSTIELLHKDGAHHLMGKRQGGEGELLVSTGIDIGREAVGTTDDENKMTGCGLLLLQPCCQLHAGGLLAMFIEQHDMVARLNLTQNLHTLRLFLLCLAETLRVFQFGNHDDVKRRIMLQATDIFIGKRCDMPVCGLPYKNECRFHTFFQNSLAKIVFFHEKMRNFVTPNSKQYEECNENDNGDGLDKPAICVQRTDRESARRL